jgi:hypothetical protein
MSWCAQGDDAWTPVFSQVRPRAPPPGTPQQSSWYEQGFLCLDLLEFEVTGCRKPNRCCDRRSRDLSAFGEALRCRLQRCGATDCLERQYRKENWTRRKCFEIDLSSDAEVREL